MKGLIYFYSLGLHGEEEEVGNKEEKNMIYSAVQYGHKGI